jgi:hypothetical protein
MFKFLTLKGKVNPDISWETLLVPGDSIFIVDAVNKRVLEYPIKFIDNAPNDNLVYVCENLGDLEGPDTDTDTAYLELPGSPIMFVDMENGFRKNRKEDRGEQRVFLVDTEKEITIPTGIYSQKLYSNDQTRKLMCHRPEVVYPLEEMSQQEVLNLAQSDGFDPHPTKTANSNSGSKADNKRKRGSIKSRVCYIGSREEINRVAESIGVLETPLGSPRKRRTLCADIKRAPGISNALGAGYVSLDRPVNSDTSRARGKSPGADMCPGGVCYVKNKKK